MKIIFCNNPNENYLSNSQLDLLKKMRAEWVNGIWLLRSYMTSYINDLGDTEYIKEQMIQESEYEDIFRRIYGIKEVINLEEVAKDHTLLEIELIHELKKGNETAVDMIREQRYENANDEIAYLTEANPYLDKDELQSKLYTHIDLTEEHFRLFLEAQNDSTKFAEELALFNKVLAQGLDTADYITEGIITQYGDIL